MELAAVWVGGVGEAGGRSGSAVAAESVAVGEGED